MKKMLVQNECALTSTSERRNVYTHAPDYRANASESINNTFISQCGKYT